MDTIKSAKAKNHIEKWQWQSKDGTFDNSPIILRSVAEYAVIIAETEAEERHQYETRWRSVEEGLPELCVPVLVKRNPDVFGGNSAEHQLCYLGKYDDGEIAWFQCEIELSACRITHWKPIE